jgi:dCTP diphosphatase
MNINKIKKTIKKFINERDWDKFHSPKNLSIALSVEASELLENFQWQSYDNKNISKLNKKKIEEEIADVFYYLITLSMKLNINIEKAFYKKMLKNRKKYLISEIKGKAIKK